MVGSEAQIICPACAAANRAGARFCRNCGATIADDDRTRPASPISTATPMFDRAKWTALALYDKEVSSFADQVRPLGTKWMDELASAYMTLGNNSYLPDIVAKIKERAEVERKEQEEREEVLRRENEQRRIEATERERARQEKGRQATERAKAEEEAQAENVRIERQRAQEESEARRERIMEFISFNKWPIVAASIVVFAAIAAAVYYLGAVPTKPNSSSGTPSQQISSLGPASTRPTELTAPVNPSFDCARVHSQVLKLICETPDLAMSDQKLAVAYSAAMSSSPSPENLRMDERAWIARRNNSKADVESLRQMYKDRIALLTGFPYQTAPASAPIQNNAAAERQKQAQTQVVEPPATPITTVAPPPVAMARRLQLGSSDRLGTGQANAAGTNVGVLTCNDSSGRGFIVGVTRELNCTFSPNKGESNSYSGTISRYGVDIGYSKGGPVIWDVITPTSSLEPDALEGIYVGATAETAVGLGHSANVLVGGLDKSIALQPVNREGMTGLNAAGAVAAVSLKQAP